MFFFKYRNTGAIVSRGIRKNISYKIDETAYLARNGR